MNKTLTPMMRQYVEIKEKHKDEILFFRLGDFYEMFFDEAIEVSRLLNLTLTKRTDVPMCGIPYHAAKIYIARLLRFGKKIAICEQVGEPYAGGLTERKVVEIITPGTVSDDDFLEGGKNNYLAAVYCSNKKVSYDNFFDYYAGFAYIDITTGNFFATSFLKSDFEEQLLREIGKINPCEILIQESLLTEFPVFKKIQADYPSMMQNAYPDWRFNAEQSEKFLCNLFGMENLKAFSLDKDSPELPPAGLLLQYLEETSGKTMQHISGIKVYRDSDFVSIDDSTRKNLELVYNLRDNTSAYTLFDVLNYTNTSMGTRLLRRVINYPLCSQKEIESRLEKLDSLLKNEAVYKNVVTALSLIYDIERVLSRVVLKKTNGKELLLLKQSLTALLSILEIFRNCKLNFFCKTKANEKLIYGLFSLLDSSISEDCSTVLNDGNLIKKGFSEEADRIKSIKENTQQILEDYLLTERKNTGINTLKIKYNKLMGYFLEVSLSNVSSVPDYFIRQRSLTNADRFTTERLKQIEDDINTAEERLIEIQKKLFSDICEKIISCRALLADSAKEIAELDVSCSLVKAAVVHSWVKPKFTENTGILKIENGRHPVVEKHLARGEFVPNSILLSSGEGVNNEEKDLPSFALITGPNMAGKSTFLRQTALIVLLAQIGSFVPADSVELSPVDKIFCRVGATDNLARGESTFLVEMIETAYILNSATKNSLVIMDEVGRGTSTEDGLAIAQSVSEYLLNDIKAKTLFATHYHELSHLKNSKLINLKLSVLETDGKIVFLKKVEKGISESSYGIHVAGLAGVPSKVLTRAENLLYLSANFKMENKTEEKEMCFKQAQLFSEEEQIINEMLSINIDGITPLTALQLISEWKKKLITQ